MSMSYRRLIFDGRSKLFGLTKIKPTDLRQEFSLKRIQYLIDVLERPRPGAESQGVVMSISNNVIHLYPCLQTVSSVLSFG